MPQERLRWLSWSLLHFFTLLCARSSRLQPRGAGEEGDMNRSGREKPGGGWAPTLVELGPEQLSGQQFSSG